MRSFFTKGRRELIAKTFATLVQIAVGGAIAGNLLSRLTVAIKVGAGVAVIVAAGFAAYGWVRAGSATSPVRVDILATNQVRARVRRCGRPGCACASNPQARHPGQYLSVYVEGRTQVVHLRPADAPRVREAIAGYEELWATLTALTAVEVADLRRAARERQRGRRRRRA